MATMRYSANSFYHNYFILSYIKNSCHKVIYIYIYIILSYFYIFYFVFHIPYHISHIPFLIFHITCFIFYFFAFYISSFSFFVKYYVSYIFLWQVHASPKVATLIPALSRRVYRFSDRQIWLQKVRGLWICAVN